VTATAAATTTTAAATGFEVAGFGDAAELEGLTDILADGLLDFLHFVLGIEEAAGDGIFQEGFAEFFEVVDFAFFQFEAGMALLLEEVALGDEGVVLTADDVIGEESLDLSAQGLDFRLVQNGLAKFFRLLDDDRFFGLSLHNIFWFRAARVLPRQRHNTPQVGGKCKRGKGPGGDSGWPLNPARAG
jgi:hypothetical protein